MSNSANKGSFQAVHGEQEAPHRAHMALQTGAIDGDPESLIAIPEGSHLFFIEDPRYAQTIIEVILEKVIYENHIFKGIRCYARGSDGKTRKLHMMAAWTGEFKSMTESAHKAADEEIKKAIK